MMNDILKQIKAGEVSGVQFKERILDKYDIACELIAFSNSHGGKLVVGIKDKTGETNATFMNNDKAQEFVITVWRGESNQVEVESNQVGNEVEWKSNQVEGASNQVGNEVHDKSNQVEDHNTGLRHSDTDLDTGLRHSDTDLATDHDTFVEDHDTIHSYHDTNHDTKRVPLTNKQKDIVNFCSVPRTSREILERAGVVYHTKNIAKYITSLVAAGYLQMTNPDNPTASNQKYKKVNKR